MNLKGKVIVITGATGGLGLALAEELQSQGSLVVISSKDSKKVGLVASRLKCLGIAADVAKESQVKTLATRTMKQYGKIDIWINNAGVSMLQGNLEQINIKEAHELMEVNYFGTVYGCRQAIRVMKKNRGGIIVNILSLSCFDNHPNAMSLNYYASKFAADALTRGLQPLLASNGITVIGIYPGGIKTKLHGLRRRANYHEFMEPNFVAEAIVKNLRLSKPLQQVKIWKRSR